MITFLFLFNGLTDFYFYKRVICRFTKARWIRITHWSVTILFVGMLGWLISKFSNPGTDATSNIYIWIIYFYLLVYVPKLVYMLISWPELFLKRTKAFSVAGGTLSLLIAAGLIWGATGGRFCFRENVAEVASTRLPESFEGYTIVQFSDTHLGNFGHSDSIMHELVCRINDIQPDLILFTGDLVNTKANEIDRFASILKTLKARDGVFSVMGNHDYGDYVYWKTKADHDANLQSLYDKQAQLGWRVLRNESVYIKRGRDSIALIGVENWGEPPFHQYGDLDKAIKNVKQNSFKVLMSHNPEHWRQVVVPRYDINLTLAGHTHAWQMAFGWGNHRYSPAVFKYKNWGGLYTSGEKHIYVNEGTGYVLYPMRFGAGPEISVIKLRRK